MSEPAEVDVDCAVCGCSATVTDRDNVGVEHLLQVWSRLHEHTADERLHWYAVVAEQYRVEDE